MRFSKFYQYIECDKIHSGKSQSDLKKTSSTLLFFKCSRIRNISLLQFHRLYHHINFFGRYFQFDDRINHCFPSKGMNKFNLIRAINSKTAQIYEK